MNSPLGYSVRERGTGSARRFVVAFAHLAQGGKSWPERTAPRELRTRTTVAKWAEGEIAAASVAAPLKPKRPAGPTVRAIYPGWLAQVSKRPDLQPATIEGYRSAFAAVLLGLDLAETGEPPQLLGDEPAAALDVPRCRRLLRALRDCPAPRFVPRAAPESEPAAVPSPPRTLSASRINNCASALSAFLSDLVADRHVPFVTNPLLDPAVRRELPPRPLARRVAVDDERPGCATLEDAQAVIDAPTTPAEVRARVALAFTGGMRDGEIAGLRVRAIRRMLVPHLVISEAVKIVGPGGRNTPGELKTASSERVVPLHPASLAALDEWLSVHWIRLTGRAPGPNDFVFVRPGTTEPYRPRMERLFRRALGAAGRPTERGGAAVTFHRARHAFASALARAGAPLELRKLLLGHAAASVTEAVYTEHGLEQLRAAVAGAIPIVWRKRDAERRRLCPAKAGRDEGQSAAGGRPLDPVEAGKPIADSRGTDRRGGGILAPSPRRGGEAGGFQERDMGAAGVNDARQPARQNARQPAEQIRPNHAEPQEVRTGFEPAWDGFANLRGLGNEGGVRPLRGAKKAAAGHGGNGPRVGDGPTKRSAKPGCRAAEGMRRTAAAGLSVGLHDAMYATLGVDVDGLILGAKP